MDLGLSSEEALKESLDADFKIYDINGRAYLNGEKVCAVDGCRNLLSGRRLKFCSDKCAKIMNRQNRERTSEQVSVRGARIYNSVLRKTVERDTKLKLVRCLRCDRKFFGTNSHRICSSCNEINSDIGPRAEGVRASVYGRSYDESYDLGLDAGFEDFSPSSQF